MSMDGNYQHIPWITGIVEHEGAVRAACMLNCSNNFVFLLIELQQF